MSALNPLTVTEVMAAISTAVLGWAAIRVVKQQDKANEVLAAHTVALAEIKKQLSNGLVSVIHDIKESQHEMKTELHEHAQGEEDRLVKAILRYRLFGNGEIGT